MIWIHFLDNTIYKRVLYYYNKIIRWVAGGDRQEGRQVGGEVCEKVGRKVGREVGREVGKEVGREVDREVSRENGAGECRRR